MINGVAFAGGGEGGEKKAMNAVNSNGDDQTGLLAREEKFPMPTAALYLFILEAPPCALNLFMTANFTSCDFASKKLFSRCLFSFLFHRRGF